MIQVCDYYSDYIRFNVNKIKSDNKILLQDLSINLVKFNKIRSIRNEIALNKISKFHGRYLR